METPDLLAGDLLHEQHSDGGWGYGSRSSWTEPTALAILALKACGAQSERPVARGTKWLLDRQREDGGWAPCDDVRTSTWVTSLALLALGCQPSTSEQRRRASDWLVRRRVASYTVLQRVQRRFLGLPAEEDLQGGSPWYPGTAAWVIPTALSIVALRTMRREKETQLNGDIRDAQRYLLSRRCLDGGWNHGGSRYHSEAAPSYPETTGVALLALAGWPAADDLRDSLRRAEQLLWKPQSLEGLSCLQLGLAAHGRRVYSETTLRCWNVRDRAYRLLALNAGSPQNPLSEAAVV